MNKLPNISGGGLIKGVYFVINDADNTIKVRVSSMSGMEQVYFNNELVSDKRSAGLESEHNFVIDGDEFKVNIEEVSVIKGKLLWVLSKNNTVIKKLRSKFNNTSYGFIFTLIIMILFVIYAVLGMYVDIPGWIPVMFIAIVIAVKYFMSKRGLFLVEEILQ